MLGQYLRGIFCQVHVCPQPAFYLYICDGVTMRLRLAVNLLGRPSRLKSPCLTLLLFSFSFSMFLDSFLLFMCRWECSAPRGRKRASYPLELDLQIVLADSGCHECAGKQSQPVEEQGVLLIIELSLQFPFSPLKCTKMLMKPFHKLFT